MDDMSKYYFTKDQIKEQVALLDKYKTNSEEYKNLGLKIIASYCKQLILTNSGISHGLELVKKHQAGEHQLNRTELIKLYILGTEANLITGGNGTYELLSEVWGKLYNKYKPEVEYLQAYIYDILFPEGYMQGNPNYTDSLNQVVKSYTDDRPALKAIFFTIDIHIMQGRAKE